MKRKRNEIFITAQEIATLRNLGWEGILRKAMTYNLTIEKGRKKKNNKECK